MVLMQKPSVVDPPPPGGAPMKAPRWDLVDTEGCGGGNNFSWCSWMFSGYMDIYRRKKQVGEASRGPRGWGGNPPPRARRAPSWPPRLLLDLHSKSPGLRLFQKDHSRRFHSVWTRFDIPFFETLKQAKSSNTGWASGQQVSPKNDIKM